MYASHFGLRQEPFSIAPDPRFLHLSQGHREALAHLLYGLQGGGGFVLLTGEIGAGKTTVCRCFLEQMPPRHRVAYIVNPKLSALELVQTVCQEFDLRLPRAGATVKPYLDLLNRFLLQAHGNGESCLLVVDEAQGLASELLEQLRLLTNLETDERKLLQIVLIGQPELRDKLARPELEQLSQRVIARVHLGPLSADETGAYVQHRLAVAGHQGPLPFDRRALAWVHRLSGGIPRRINLLCQRAMLGAYGRGEHRVDSRLVRQAAREAFGNEPRPGPWQRRPWLVATSLAGLVAAALTMFALRQVEPASRQAASAAAAASLPDAQMLNPFATESAAWRAMASAWQLPAAASPADCRAARQWQLACHEGSADLELLRRLDRPALLSLRTGGLVLLRGLDGDSARLLGAGGEQRMRLVWVQAAWTGRYATWWRAPQGWLAAGDRIDALTAAWLLDRLALIQGDAGIDTRRVPRDELLRRRVFAFQTTQGLVADGEPGPLVLMQLNRASGIAEPRLRPEG